MPQDTRNQQEIKLDILRRLDPGGEMSDLIRAFTPLGDSKLAKGFLRLLGVELDKLNEPLAQADQLLESMASSVLVFTPLGWAPSSRVPADVYVRALEVYRNTRSIEQAESALVEGWNSEDRLRWSIMPIKRLGSGHETFHNIFMRRFELVDRALRHHQSGAYEASVPIVLFQVDGIVWDLTDPSVGFFAGRGPGEHLVDNRTVAGVPEGLKPLRKLFSQDMKRSGMTERLSRHGILHGRELAYDTIANSTKAFVLLLAVMEWAEPRARYLAEKLERQREMRHAGSNKTDERGRRLDARGFKTAKESLRRLGTMQMGQWRNHGRYASYLEGMAPGHLGDRMLQGKSEIKLFVSGDKREFWAWRTTASGFCFGIAGRDGPPNEWLYAGRSPPAGGIDDDDWRGLGDIHPPDWE